MYIFGMCETILDDFGPGGQLLPNATAGYLPAGQWQEYGYGTILLALVGIICLVGADIYAKATFGIFILVGAAIISVIGSTHTFDFVHESSFVYSLILCGRCEGDSDYQRGLAKSY